jgi:hypothetical protein
MSLLRRKKKSSGDGDESSKNGGSSASCLTTSTLSRPVITCAILLMESPNASSSSSTPAGRKKFEVLQVSFTQDATAKSVLANVKLQSAHNAQSLAQGCGGLCRPGGAEFVNSFAIKKYGVKQNELLLGIPVGLTAAQTARHSENMRRSSKLKALLQSMEIQPIQSPESAVGNPPMSPSYIVYAGPKEKKAEPVPEPQAEPEPEPETPLSENGGSKLEVTAYEEVDNAAASIDSDSVSLPSMLSSKAKDMASSATPTTGLKFTVFLCFLAFFSVLRRNVQPFVSLAPGSVATHLSILETVPVVIGEAPSQSPTRAVGMAVGFVKESLKAIVEPQPATEAFEVARQRVSPSFAVLSLTPDGEASLIKHQKTLWKQQGEPMSELYLDANGDLRLGKEKVVVSDNLKSSWPFDAGSTTKHQNGLLRRATGFAVAAGGVLLLKTLPPIVWSATARVFGSKGAAQVFKGGAKAAAGKKAVRAGGRFARKVVTK